MIDGAKERDGGSRRSKRPGIPMTSPGVAQRAADYFCGPNAPVKYIKAK